MGSSDECHLEQEQRGGAYGRRGWLARLDLVFERRAGISVLAERRHSGPLVVQRPFYPEGDVCHVYVVHPPGGVVAGDELALLARVLPHAHALVTAPAAGKFYRSEGLTARVAQVFTVEDGILEWLPQENILYPQSVAAIETRVRLSGAGRFFGWEVACFGLRAQAEHFRRGELHQTLELEVDGDLVLCERQRIDWECITARWGMAGNTVAGTLLAYPARARDVDAARGAAQGDVILSCTLVDRAMICRAIAVRGDQLRHTFVAVWKALRPLLLQRAAVLPRVWAT